MSTHQSIEICCLICVFIKSHWTDKATITYLSSDFCCHLSRFLTAKILYCNSMLILSPVLSIICVPSSLEHHSPLYPGAFATVQHILNICKNSGWVCAGCQVSYHTLFFFFFVLPVEWFTGIVSAVVTQVHYVHGMICSTSWRPCQTKGCPFLSLFQIILKV